MDSSETQSSHLTKYLNSYLSSRETRSTYLTHYFNSDIVSSETQSTHLTNCLKLYVFRNGIIASLLVYLLKPDPVPVLTLLLLNTSRPVLAYSVDPDQLASEEANWSGSALFVIKYVNFCQKHESSNLTDWKLEVGVAS